MTLEQRLAAVEAELASLKAHQKNSKEVAAMVRKTTIETIKNARRPGGVLYRSEDVRVHIGDAIIKSATVEAASLNAAEHHTLKSISLDDIDSAIMASEAFSALRQ